MPNTTPPATTEQTPPAQTGTGDTSTTASGQDYVPHTGPPAEEG